MSVRFEDLRVLQVAEGVADGVWKLVVAWDGFAKDTVGKQLVRAVDSVGANIAEGYGRFHFGEKLQFFYYARGSLFETKYWLNRAKNRQLLSEQICEEYGRQLSNLALQLNTLAKQTKQQRYSSSKRQNSVREKKTAYSISDEADLDYYISNHVELFSSDEIAQFKIFTDLLDGELPNYVVPKERITQLPLKDRS